MSDWIGMTPAPRAPRPLRTRTGDGSVALGVDQIEAGKCPGVLAHRVIEGAA